MQAVDYLIGALVIALFAAPLAGALIVRRRFRGPKHAPLPSPPPPRRMPLLERPCPSCQARVSVLDTTCGNCGAKLPSRRPLCPRCGLQVSATMKFCQRCRTRVAV